MGSCNCGGKTVPFKKANLKKKNIPKGSTAKGGSAKELKGRAKRLSAAATKKAKANATGCTCTQ